MATHRETVTLYPAAYLSGQNASISGSNNPIGKGSNSTAYATINLKTGSRAETWAYYSFNTSAIPENARIISVACSSKCYINTTTNSRVATRQVQLFTGTTAKGSASTVSTSTTALTMTCGTWTREELNDCRVRVYGVRGTSNTSTTYYFRYYGSTLTITYEWDDIPSETHLMKVNGQWKEAKIWKRISGSWVQQDSAGGVFSDKIYLKK